jgi:hypothetical protein
MNYAPEQRSEVIRQAYRGLFELTAPMMFDKYVDFIDVYAGIREDEREAIFREMTEQEDTAMLAQYIKNKGFQAWINWIGGLIGHWKQTPFRLFWRNNQKQRRSYLTMDRQISKFTATSPVCLSQQLPPPVSRHHRCGFA